MRERKQQQQQKHGKTQREILARRLIPRRPTISTTTKDQISHRGQIRWRTIGHRSGRSCRNARGESRAGMGVGQESASHA